MNAEQFQAILQLIAQLGGTSADAVIYFALIRYGAEVIGWLIGAGITCYLGTLARHIIETFIKA